MFRPVTLRDEPCTRELVEGPLLEADRERAQRLGALLCGEGSEERRVDAARKQNAHGHVTDEVRAHGVPQTRSQLLDELRLLVLAQLLERCRTGKASQLETAVFPDQQMSRRELADFAEDRQRCRDRVEREERFQRVEVDLAARQGAQLGGEGKLVVGVAVIEGLDSEAVPCKYEPPVACVPDRDREHAPQTLGEAVSVLLVEM